MWLRSLAGLSCVSLQCVGAYCILTGSSTPLAKGFLILFFVVDLQYYVTAFSEWTEKVSYM